MSVQRLRLLLHEGHMSRRQEAVVWAGDFPA